MNATAGVEKNRTVKLHPSGENIISGNTLKYQMHLQVIKQTEETVKPI